MRISVIVPLYNGAPWIRETLDSVRAQELKPDRVIVVDDGSTDGSPEIVSRFPDVILARNPGKGSCMSRNHGLTLCDSPLIAFLDQDDLWHPAHLRLLHDALDQYPQAGMAFATAAIFDAQPPRYEPSQSGISFFDPWPRFPFTIGVDGPSLALVRREALAEIGYWEEQSTGMGDALLFLKLAVLHPLLKLSASTVGKRVHARSQWLRVREWSAKYLAFRHKVMSLALDFRRRRAPHDPDLPIFERRLAAIPTLARLCEAMSSPSDGLAGAAHQLESDLAGDPELSFRHAFYCLMGALFPIHDSEQLRVERDRVFGAMLERWPQDAARTRAALSSIIGESPRVS